MCTQCLRALAVANERFIELATAARSRGDVAGVIHRMEARTYRTGARWELFVEATLHSGLGVCWWLDISEDPAGWRIEPTIFLQDLESQLHIWAGGSLTHSDSDFLQALTQAVDDLTHRLDLALKAAVSHR